MIVVVGTPAWNPGPPPRPAGTACTVALEAAARGASVELVGRAGDDDAGDALMIALAAAGVGHIAVLRDPARPTVRVTTPTLDPGDEDPHVLADADAASPATDPQGATRAIAGEPVQAPVLEPADVSLGLRYITAFGVLVLADDAGPEIREVAIEAAAFAGAHLVVLVPEWSAVPEDVPPAATVLAAPAEDPDGAFAALVGAYAAALDAGSPPDTAFEAARGAWDRPSP